MRKKMKQFLMNLIPQYSIIPLILALAFNLLVYDGAKIIAGGWYHHNMETALDQMIPFWAPSAAIYLGCYLFWAANYIMIGRQDKTKVCQFFAGDILSRGICLFFFLVFPTTNIRPEVGDTGFWNQVMRLIYAVDSADNLFPSIHCLVSWFCYIGVKDRADIPVWYRRFSGVFAVLVCISTLTTKQHVIVDAIGGVFLAEFCFRVGKLPFLYRKYEILTDWFTNKIFAVGSKGEEPHADKEKGTA